MSLINTWLKKITNLWIIEEDNIENNSETLNNNKLLLNYAHQEVVEARNLLSSVDDPELIDYAIFKLQAAEKKYNYLIKIEKTK
ncbi:hypothetical protein SYNTR_2001 [Candidatus Syntrophocurvum alkaliphilum]|uniref:DUF2508 domain-containing protein n=1 Tax=Candidatus Syntrophocurvum alkaliphilum TaxID=2293317 RepID=A0A6I6DDC0_9FIRM|nr:DUF2508 family protein [Candidatus Syntrophocurvum alkaliphilum]QGU00595.1 hypothetical protein SYNTR_2001 [Candidatus Syntrophocurvum alkaliphilum]